MATRIDSTFNLGTNYQGRFLVQDTSTNQSANQSTVRFRLYVRKTAGSGFFNGSSSARSWSVSGIAQTSPTSASGSSSYDYRPPAVNEWVEIADFNRTITHDTNGSYSDSISRSISHVDNPPGSGSGSNTLSLTNFPEPTSTGFSSSNVSVVTATIGASGGSNGNGSSRTLEFFYRVKGESEWTSAGSGSANSTKDLTGLIPATDYQWYIKTTNNTGNSSNGAVQEFTTLPAPSTSVVLLSILGVI